MRRRELAIYALAFGASLVGHVSVFEGLGRAAREAPRERPRVLEFAVVERPPAAVEAPAPEEPPPPAPEKPKPPRPKPVDLTKLAKLPPPESPPPPNTSEEVAETAEKPRPVFGVSMRSVVGPGSSSGFTVRVGNTLMKEPEKEYTEPADVKPYAPVPLYQVTKMPRPLRACDKPSVTVLEGQVQLEVEVLADGAVGEVKLVRGVSAEVDAAVIEAVRRCRFRPAEVGGQAVATRIPYKYTFVPED